MKKYAIKNCPSCYDFFAHYCVNDLDERECKDISDCPFKKIVNICKENISNALALEILDILDIWEVIDDRAD